MLTLLQEQGSAASLAFSNPLGVRSRAPSVILVLAICRQANFLRAASVLAGCRRLVSARAGRPSGAGGYLTRCRSLHEPRQGSYGNGAGGINQQLQRRGEHEPAQLLPLLQAVQVPRQGQL